MEWEVTAFAPGRVNLIGEHTDYNGGLALPFAIQRGVSVRARAQSGGRIEVSAADQGERENFALADLDPAGAGTGWVAFVRGAAGELARSGVELSGAVLEISGDVPQGAGLSSSAALEVALCLAMIELSATPGPEPLELVRLCSRIENRWTGAQTGLLDQIASLLAEEDHALLIDFRDLAITPVPVRLGEHRLVVLDSGESHANAASGYNERRRECAAACSRLGVDSLREVTEPMLASLPEPLDRRVRHVITENRRVKETVAALRGDDRSAVGAQLDASHASLRDDYEISTPAVEAAVKRCRDAGAIGARLVGGGFGGSVLALMAPGAEAPEGSVEVRPGPGAAQLLAR
ncbi:MAG: galactokinase [Solirubrobacteraceae bacterium]